MARKKKPSGKKKPRDPARMQGRKPGKRTVLIVCEGAKTEPTYFKALHQSLRGKNIQVEVVGGGGRTSAIQVVEQALRRKQDRENELLRNSKRAKFDAIWCVFDYESVHTNPSFVTAVNVATQNALNLGVSNPSFEYWYLLHFEETARSFQNATDVIRQLKKQMPEYEKSANIFALLQPMTVTAVKRAKGILKNYPDKDEPHPNPSTHVHKLVEQLIT